MSLMTKSITRGALNVQVHRKPGKQTKKTYATRLTDTKARATKVFKFDHEGVCISIELVKPHAKRT